MTKTPDMSLQAVERRDPARIYLQPACSVDPDGYEGRQWCEDDVWEECHVEGCSCRATTYIRADLAALEATPSLHPEGEGLRAAVEHLLHVGEFCRTDDTESALRRVRLALTPSTVTEGTVPDDGVLDPWLRLWKVAFAPFDNGPGKGVGSAPEDAGVGPRMPTSWPTIADLRALAASPKPTETVTDDGVGQADAEVERILSLSDDQVLAEASPEDLAWARLFKARMIAIKHALPGRYDGVSTHAAIRGDADNAPYMLAIQEALAASPKPTTVESSGMVERLRAALQKYGRHETNVAGVPGGGCQGVWPFEKHPCTCGLNAVLSGERK